MTARDLAPWPSGIINDFPEYYKFYNERNSPVTASARRTATRCWQACPAPTG